MLTRRTLLPAAATAAATASAPATWAQSGVAAYPTRPIRMIVPFAAGGAADLVARVTAQGMSEHLGQSVVVENRGGSGGVIGTEAVLSAPADGYTIAFHSMSSAVLNAGLYRNLSFDIRRAFAPVSLVGTVPNIVVVNPRVPAHSLQELIALLKREPGRHTYASSGAGTIVHLSAHMLAQMAGAEVVHVPYRGSGPAMNDLIAGTVDFMVDTLPTVIPFVRDGKLRALAVTTRERSPTLPEVPTAAEAGLPGYETYNWHAVFVPAGVPAEVVPVLERAVRAAATTGTTHRRLVDVGVDPRGSTAAELEAFWDAQLSLWIPIVRSSGATAD
ncbi:MAG: tripartite tricarboxylate transporter substrate binding protein [Acetobacteraceae bacterium]|nr:tripartite tricarboxylate transporter substrate binding protein [Acetobacteraceae bacterium]